MGELGDEGADSEQFGDLPPRMRDRILQARQAGFPKEYEEYLERYYRRLAREEAELKGGDEKKDDE